MSSLYVNGGIVVENVELMIKQLDITKSEFYKRSKISSATFSNWRTGAFSPSRKNLENAANALGVTVEWLVTDHKDRIKKAVTYDAIIPPGFSPMPKMVKRPLVGRIACGEPITAEQNIEKYVDVPEDVRCDFCLECDGDSMIDVGIHSGDVVYIRIQPEVENGEIAAVRIGEEATLKKVYYDGERLILMPCNSAYQPKTYAGPALADIKIEGKAVGFTHWFEK